MSTTTSSAEVLEHVAAMAGAARLAPSVHNTQPWRFRRLTDGLAVHEDPRRGLPVLDPTGRLRVISCGAAVANAAVAVAARGVRPRVDVLPDAGDPTLVATVHVGAPRRPSAADVADGFAISRRRTHRRVHSRRAVPRELLVDLAHAVSREGARLSVADDAGRRALAALLVRAVRRQAARPEFLDEVESWVRHWGPAREPVDGIPVGSLGTAPYPVDSVVQEQTDLSGIQEQELVEGLAGSAVVAVHTSGDRRRDWVLAGMALERLLLRVTAAGAVATFADQATQDDATRGDVAAALDVLGYPQVVLRLGYPLVEVPPTPRRSVEDLLA